MINILLGFKFNKCIHLVNILDFIILIIIMTENQLDIIN